MNKIITKLLLLIAFVVSVNVAYAKDNDASQLQYSIKSNGSGQQGYWVVEVTAYVTKKSDINNTILQKCAVHGALFKGVAGGQGGSPQKPLCSSTSAETQYSDFFNAFFQQDFKNYADVVEGTLSTTQVGKGYEVTATVQIAKDNLRKAMEEAGIIRKLGF
ncbi:MAG: hypothetical protein LUC91_05355 [Prevotella sp.]|nr:hypothetical protein [Prevotella sp.]